MDGLTFPGRTSQTTDCELIASIIARTATLEGFLADLFAVVDARLTLVNVTDDERRLLGVVALPNGSEVFVAFPERNVRKGRSIFDPATAVSTLADTGAPVIDPLWLENRDKKYGIRPAANGEYFVRPSKAVDLMLSYALATNGQVVLTQTFGPIGRCRFGPLLGLRLSYLGDETSPGYEEFLQVDLAKLSAGAARANVRMGSEATPPSAAG